MKRIMIGLFIIFFVTLISSVIDSAQAYMVTVDFGFTATNTWGYPFSTGDKGTGWFTYDNEIPGSIYDYPSPHHDTGYYQGGKLYIGTSDYVIYSGDVGLAMYNDYYGSDEYLVGCQYASGDSNYTYIELSFVGQDNLWNELPPTLPVPDFDSFTVVKKGQIWNYNYAQGGIIDKQVDFSFDYIKASPVPEPATMLLLGLGLSGLGLLRKKKS